MDGADVGRAVAEEGHGDPRLVAQLEGERGAGDRGEPAADDRVRAHVPALDVVEVHRAAVAVRAALELAVELGHQLVRVRPLGERVPVRAVGRGDHVARPRARGRRRRRRPPGRSRRAGSRAARRRGSAPRPSPRSAGSGASRGRSPAASPRTARPSARPWPLRGQCTDNSRPWGSAERWRRSSASCRRTGTTPGCVLRVADRPARARGRAARRPLMPGRSGNEIRFYAARRGDGCRPGRGPPRSCAASTRRASGASSSSCRPATPDPAAPRSSTPRAGRGLGRCARGAAGRLERPVRRARARPRPTTSTGRRCCSRR